MDKMNRRDFLGLGAAGAGFLATTALGMTPATASAKPIEYGPAVTLPDAQIPALTGDVLQHVEKLPIAYSNRHYIFVIVPGDDDLHKAVLNPVGFESQNVFDLVDEKIEESARSSSACL